VVEGMKKGIEKPTEGVRKKESMEERKEEPLT
jgi:hypothetical protein